VGRAELVDCARSVSWGGGGSPRRSRGVRVVVVCAVRVVVVCAVRVVVVGGVRVVVVCARAWSVRSAAVASCRVSGVGSGAGVAANRAVRRGLLGCGGVSGWWGWVGVQAGGFGLRRGDPGASFRGALAVAHAETPALAARGDCGERAPCGLTRSAEGVAGRQLRRLHFRGTRLLTRLPTRGLYHRSPGEQGVDLGQGFVVGFVEARR